MQLVPYDSSNLFLISGNDREFVIEILQMFVETVPNEISAINGAFNLNDLAQLKFVVHRLRSSAGSAGANNILASCREIESYIKNGGDNTQVLSDLLKNFFTSCEFDMAEIKKELFKLGQNSLDWPN